MKAMIDNGRVVNIVPNNYDPGNPATVIEDITSVDFTIPEKGIMGSAISKCGSPKYYLDNGVLKKYTKAEKQAMPEAIAYKKRKLKEKYADLDTGSDNELYDFLEALAKTHPLGQVWLTRKNVIKGEVE